MIRRSVLLLLLITPGLGALNFWSDLPNDQLAANLVASMSVEELAGQVLLFTYAGDSPSAQFLELSRKWNLGGIKIFGWNANSIAALTSSVAQMQTLAQQTRFKIPLIVATDQEGGWVRHIRGATSQTPGNLAIGSSRLPYDALMTGFYIGEELRLLGINMNFAPTVDIYSLETNSVIGPRSFSSDPVQTAILATAFYKGLEKSGVMATAKHFPGHGHTPDDSHGRLPEVDVDLATLEKRELVPYDYLIRDGIPAIMSGHLAFPKITGNTEAASLNPYFSRDLVRNKLGFKNIMITDDLFMEGARLPGKGLEYSAEKALRAGNDMIMMSQPLTDQIATWELFRKLARQEEGFLNRLKEAAGRILMMKLRYLKPDNRVPLYPQAATAMSRIPSQEARAFFFSQAARSVTLLRSRRVPLEDKAPLVITPYPQFFSAVKARFPGARHFDLDWNPYFSFSNSQAEELKRLLPSASSVVFNLVTPGSAELLKTLKTWGGKITVVSLLTPVYLKDMPWIDSAIAAFGTGPDSLEVAAAVLAGDFVPQGQLPLKINP